MAVHIWMSGGSLWAPETAVPPTCLKVLDKNESLRLWELRDIFVHSFNTRSMSVCPVPRPAVYKAGLVPVLRELTVLGLKCRGVQPRRGHRGINF